MSSKTESANSSMDTAILALAVLILAASLFGFYYVQGQVNEVVRILGVLVGCGIAVAVGVQTAVGRLTWSYIKGSRVELRKVVWPTRKTTVQTTLVVLVIVLLTAAFLWICDTILGQLIGLLLGR